MLLVHDSPETLSRLRTVVEDSLPRGEIALELVGKDTVSPLETRANSLLKAKADTGQSFVVVVVDLYLTDRIGDFENPEGLSVLEHAASVSPETHRILVSARRLESLPEIAGACVISMHYDNPDWVDQLQSKLREIDGRSSW